MEPPTLVLFDLMDTVLYDPYREALAAGLCGLEPARAFAMRTRDTWPRFERGEITEHEFGASFFDPSRCEGEVPRFDIEAFNRVRLAGYTFVEGMEELLRELSREVTCHLASNYPVWIHDVVERFALTQWITATHASCVMGMRKPDAAYFARVLETANVRAEQCLFVDDREENCAAAREMGMRAVRFEGTEPLRSALREMGFLQG